MTEVATDQFESLKNTCRKLDDPRTPINILHPVENILAIAIAAIIAGAEGPKSIVRWADNKKQWLGTWLDLPKGQTPSRDCIRTFFGRVEPAAFQACFFHWLDGLTHDQQQPGDCPVVAIDGKALAN